MSQAIGMVESQARRQPDEVVDGLCEHLRERTMLLLLDNCEHLIDAVARLADSVLARCPDVAAALVRAEGLGAKVIQPATDLPAGPTVGLLADPQGHVVGLVQG